MSKLESKLSSVTLVGVDLAKSVFQLHGVDAKGARVFGRKLKRSAFLDFFRGLEPCDVAMEACSSAHHWARELERLGHRAKLIPAAHVKPYVRRNKNDAADAAAICEAAGRPGQRFVGVRSIENQAELMRHRTRELLMSQRTALINALRGHLAEIGVVAGRGVERAYELKAMLAEGADEHGEIVIPECVRLSLAPLAAQIDALDASLEEIDGKIHEGAKADERARRLMTIPGIGPITASALLASIPDIREFGRARDFSAFLGLTPRQHSSGGKERLGRISKMGDRYVRKLLVVGATSALRTAGGHADRLRTWASQIFKRKSGQSGHTAGAFKVAAVALANKLARIVFALLRSDKAYEGHQLAAA